MSSETRQQTPVVIQEREADSTDSGIAGDSQSVSPHTHFPGVRLLSSSPWRDSVTSEGNIVSWPEIGIFFDIPQGAVPPKQVLNLTVWPCVGGPFVLPPGYKLASPVFIVGPAFKFIKDIQLSMAHFVKLQSRDDCQKMVFVSAPSTPQSDGGKGLGYHFKVFGRGVFHVNQPVGSLSLSHFCALGIAQEIREGDCMSQCSICFHSRLRPINDFKNGHT